MKTRYRGLTATHTPSSPTCSVAASKTTRYAVERFRSMDDGDIRPLPAGGRTKKRTPRDEARDRLPESRAADAARAGRDHRLHGPEPQGLGRAVLGICKRRDFLENAGSAEVKSPLRRTSCRPRAGRPSSVFQPPEGGGQACPTKTPTKPAPMSASATADGQPNASRKACAPGAGRPRPAPGRKRMRPLRREAARVTERARYARGKAAGEALRRTGSLRAAAGAARERSKRRRHGRREAGLCTRCGDTSPRRGRRRLRTLPRGDAARPSGNSTPRGEPPACAGGAASLTFKSASLCGPCAALCGRARQGEEERRPPGALRPTARPDVFAPIAANPHEGDGEV